MNSFHESPASADDLSSGNPTGLVLDRIPGTFGICRLSPKARIPRWVHRSVFYTVSRSPNELSILCEDRVIPTRLKAERGWSAIKIAGTLDFSLIGVLASLAGPLAEARIGLFTVSTYDTDYLLVREKRLDDAITVLESAGHTFDLRLLESPESLTAGPEVAEEPESPETVRREPEPQAQETQRDAKPAARAPVPTARSRDSVEVSAASPESSTEAGASLEDPPEPKLAVPEPPRRGLRGAFGRVLGGGRGSRPKSEPFPETRTWQPTRATQPEEGERSEHETVSAQQGTGAPQPRTVAPGREVAASEPQAPDTRGEQEKPAPEVEGSESKGLFTGAIPQHPVEITDRSFADLGLSPPILETVREVGFEHPTPIQAQVIPHALSGRDVIGLAETGSGKTAAFSLPLAERLHHGRGTRGLILCPTREIALQTKAFLDIFGRDHQLETVAVIGGVRMGPQIDGFRRDADILVATPGRLADHMRRRNVRLDKIEELVLDEADHMLDLGFLPQIKEILEQVPDQRQTLMFSATMPQPIERLAQIFMRDPVRCDIRPTGQIATGIEHRLYLVKDEDRKNCLFALLREIEGSTLIFVRRKLYTEWLARQIKLAGFGVSRIHSDRTQGQRVEALRAFREGKVRILVATDVAARGIDVPLIQHVINYGLPEQTEDYVHRAGRTARGSTTGIVSTIGTWQDKLTVREIELDLGIAMPRCEVEGVEPYVELPKRKVVRRRRLL